MNRTYKSAVRILLLVFLLAACESVHGQWKVLNNFGSQIYSIHFLDREGYRQIGFVGLSGGGVWRTSDGGISWQKSVFPAGVFGAIRNFSFKDSLTGWLAASQGDNDPGCFMTTDGGINWSPLAPTGERMSVYFNPTTQTLNLASWSRGSVANISQVSTDYGTTWTNVSNTGWINGYAFGTGLNGLMTCFRQDANTIGHFSSTTDGGLSWQDLTQPTESWQPLAIRGTPTYFIAAEGARQILRSDDNGKSWQMLHQFPATLDLTGDIRGDLQALYIQTKTGTQYSVDQGQTWTDYCGPKSDFDTRMYLIGDSLYAGTIEGQLWINPFGVKHNKLLLQFPQQNGLDLVSNGCKSVDSLFRILNLSNCLEVKIIDVTIPTGLGSKLFTLKKPQLPRTLVTGKDSIKVTYTPDNSTTDSAQLYIKYSVGNQVFELYVRLRGFVSPGFNVTLSKDLALLLSSDCAKLDTFVTVRSSACDADSILSATLSDATAFTLNAPPLPVVVPAGTALQVPLSIKAIGAGSYHAVLTLKIKSGGITRDTTINLDMTILASGDPRTTLSQSKVKFDTVAVCANVVDTIVLKNTICKNLFVKSMKAVPAAAATEFSITYLDRYGAIRSANIADTLAQKDTALVFIRYAPTVGGTVTGSLVFTLGFDLVITKDTTIVITGIGKALAGSALGSSLLSFPTTVPCTTQELSTYLYNNGCGIDTIVGFIGAGDKSYSILGPKAPLVLGSGDSALIRIQEDAQSAGAKFDSVRVIVHSSTGAFDTVTVKVTGIVNPPKHVLSLDGLLKLDSLAPCTPFDTVMQCKNLGLCDTLQIDSVAVSGAGWFFLGAAVVPARILPGQSFSYTLHFTPGAKASSTGTVHLYGAGFDTTMNIIANSRSGGSPLALTIDSVFASSLCKPAQNIFTFQNTSCDPITFEKMTLANGLPGATQFSFGKTLSLPIILKPGEKIDFIITFDPSLTGDSTATFFYSSAGSGLVRTYRLVGKLSTSKQIAHLELMIDPNLKLATVGAGNAVTVHLFMQDNVNGSLGLKNVKATLAYFDNVLSVLSSSAGPGWSLNSTNTSTAGQTTLDLSLGAGTTVAPGTEIATVKYQAFLTDSTYTKIDLQNIEFNTGDPIFMSCVLTPLSLANIEIDITKECGNATISGYIRNPSMVLNSVRIHPNPITSGEELKIDFQLNKKSDLKLTLCDALGRTISESKQKKLTKGEQTISLRLPSLASGLYFLTIESDGMRESRNVEIIR